MKKFITIFFIMLFVLVIGVSAFIAIAQVGKNNQFSVSQKSSFTKEDLDLKCGVNLRENEVEFSGIPCVKHWNNKDVPTKYDEFTFYLFENSKKAKKAFENKKENYEGFIEEEGNDYLISKVPGEYDASSIVYVYVHKNLIIETPLYISSEGPMLEDAAPDVYMPNRDEIITLIRNNF